MAMLNCSQTFGELKSVEQLSEIILADFIEISIITNADELPIFLKNENGLLAD